jgi:hypothetical protein
MERTRRSWQERGEPCLGELLDDPVLRALMARDRVGPEELAALVAQARARLGLSPRDLHCA